MGNDAGGGGREEATGVGSGREGEDWWQGVRPRAAYRGKTRDVINAHAVVGVQHSDLAPGADAQPVAYILCCVEGEGVQQQQGQGKVIHKVALLGQLGVDLILLMHLT